MRGCLRSPPVQVAVRAPKPAPHRPRRLPSSWPPLPLDTVPCLQRSCLPRVWCSCRGFGAPWRRPARPGEPSRRGASWRGAHRTRPRRRNPRSLSPEPLFASEPSPLRLARKQEGTFFERKPQPLERAAHGSGGDLYAAFLLKELAVLGQGEIGVEANLGRQALLQSLPLARRGSRYRPGLDVSGLAT